MALLWLNMGPILVALEQDPTISAPAIAYTRFALPDLVASEEKILFRKGITGVWHSERVDAATKLHDNSILGYNRAMGS